MLNRRMRNAAAAARPVSASGVAEISVCPSAPLETNAASMILRYLENGSWPVASSTRPDAKNANTSEHAGTTTVSQRGCRSRRSIRTLPSRHQQADLLHVRLARVELAEDLPFVHHGDAVGEREDLVQVLADQQHAHAVGGRVAQVRMHRFDRADVEPARRRGRDEQARLARELPREHDLLQGAAGEEAR